MVRNMKAMTRAPLEDIVRMASLTPAERAGVADEVGSLEAGKWADIVILDRRLRVRRVFIGGVDQD
jgi:N-acetylglucosamine-6-phosphate deacetylase